jgi:hypothetical protein
MSVELAYEDPLLSTGRTIELVTPSTISVDLTSSELGVSLDLTVLSSVSLELSIEQSLISVELSMTAISSAITLSNPDPTYSDDGNLIRVDYDGGLYKTYTYTSGLLTQVDFFDGLNTVRKTIGYVNGVWVGTTEVTL